MCPPIVANLPYSLYAVLCVVVSVWYCMSDVNLSRMSLSGRGSASALSSGVMFSDVLSSSLSRRPTMLHGTDAKPWYTHSPVHWSPLLLPTAPAVPFMRTHRSVHHRGRRRYRPQPYRPHSRPYRPHVMSTSATCSYHSDRDYRHCVTDMVHNVAIFVCGRYGCGHRWKKRSPKN